MVMAVILPVESRVAVPENPLPLPGGEDDMDCELLLYFEQVPAGTCTAVMHPAELFIATVGVALVRVLVVGAVVKVTVGVTPDL
jgi:hypothetical protein